MPRNKKMLKRPLPQKGPSLTPEQQELLDGGLQMLASMIAETHMRRIASDPNYRKRLRKRRQPEEAKKDPSE